MTLSLFISAALGIPALGGGTVYLQPGHTAASIQHDEAQADELEPEPDEVLRVDISFQEIEPDDAEHELSEQLNGAYPLDPHTEADLRRLCTRYGSRRPPALCAEVQALPEHKWVWDDAYFMMGLAPAVTLVPGAMHPHLRYDAEIGMNWFHNGAAGKRARSFTLGVDAHIFNLFDRKRPGGGADVVMSGSVGPVYVRGGLGVLGGLPYGPDPALTRAAVGGIVGVGAQISDGDWGGRVGVDYDLRVDRGLQLSHTVLLSVRFFWGM